MRYSSKIIKAGALLADTTALLAAWEPDESPQANLERARSQNILGKRTRARAEDVLAMLQDRYLDDPGVATALSRLVKHGLPSRVLTPILYFHAAQADPLLHDVVTEHFAPAYWEGRGEIAVAQVPAVIAGWMREGRALRWSRGTLLRVAQGLVATLRDFGLLAGRVRKRVAPPHLPLRALAYVAFRLHQEQPSGHRVLNSPEWRLFLLRPDDVERGFFEAHQAHLLGYHAAGRVVRLEFPAESLEEYARALLERTD